MKKGKWIVPLCVGVILALGTIAAALIPRLTMVRLVDYARSLPDDGCFVDSYGILYRVDPDRFAPDALGVRADGYVEAHVNTDIRPSGEKLSMEEFTLLSGGLLRQDGTSWRRASVLPSGLCWVKPFLTESPAQETVRAQDARVELTDIRADVEYPIDGGKSFEGELSGIYITAALTLPNGVEAEELTVWRSVKLDGRWYRLEEKLTVSDAESYVFLLSPIYRVMPPNGLYRLELWLGDEPLHFQPFRFTRKGNVISADEVD